MKRPLNQQFVHDDPYAFMLEPEKSVRTYDSTLSHPGSICSNCRSFIPGTSAHCPICFSEESVIFDLLPFNSLNHCSMPLIHV